MVPSTSLSSLSTFLLYSLAVHIIANVPSFLDPNGKFCSTINKICVGGTPYAYSAHE